MSQWAECGQASVRLKPEPPEESLRGPSVAPGLPPHPPALEQTPHPAGENLDRLPLFAGVAAGFSVAPTALRPDDLCRLNSALLMTLSPKN